MKKVILPKKSSKFEDYLTLKEAAKLVYPRPISRQAFFKHLDFFKKKIKIHSRLWLIHPVELEKFNKKRGKP
jgi:hypothetical protein